MAGTTANKLKQTQHSFSPHPPGAIVQCANSGTPQNVFPAPVKPLENRQTAPPLDHHLKEKTNWIEIVLVDMDDKPVPNIRYLITLPSGKVKEGKLNEHGKAKYEQIGPGKCTISFPDLDKDAWS